MDNYLEQFKGLIDLDAINSLREEREAAEDEEPPLETEVEVLALPDVEDETLPETKTSPVEVEETPVVKKPKPKKKGRPKGSKNKKNSPPKPVEEV